RLLGWRDRDEFLVPPACLAVVPTNQTGVGARLAVHGETTRRDRGEKVPSDDRPLRGPGHSLADRAGITCFSCRREPRSRDFKAQEPTDAPKLLRTWPLRFVSGMPPGRGPNATEGSREAASTRHAGS